MIHFTEASDDQAFDVESYDGRESCEISMNQHGACIVRVNFCDGTES